MRWRGAAVARLRSMRAARLRARLVASGDGELIREGGIGPGVRLVVGVVALHWGPTCLTCPARRRGGRPRRAL